MFQSIIKDNCFREALKIITSLRGSYAGNSDKLMELQQLEQVAERNRVALSVIDRIGARDPSLTVSFEFTHHPHFAIAMIKRS